MIGGKPYTWDGELVRVAGEIDERSRQLFVVAGLLDESFNGTCIVGSQNTQVARSTSRQ